MNRTIWFLWFQGLAAAPLVIQRCYQSWVAKNPAWDVVVLDDSTIPRYVHGRERTEIFGHSPKFTGLI